MGRTKTRDDGAVYEPILARYTRSPTGFPLSVEEARTHFGAGVMPSEWVAGGWFWSFSTPASARDIRRRGHRAVGTEFTTFIPPQDGPEIDEETLAYDEERIPVWGSQAHTDLMIAETREREALAEG